MKLRHLLALIVLATSSCAFADSVGFYYQDSNSTISVHQSDNQNYGYGHNRSYDPNPGLHGGHYKPHKYTYGHGPSYDKRHHRREIARHEHERAYACNRMSEPQRPHLAGY